MNRKQKIIIGITGTLGAGKSAIVDYLKTKGFKYFSVREFLKEEIKKRNMPVNRDSMVVLANDLREKYSPSYIVDELYKKAKNVNENCIIESIRTVGEISSLKSKENFYLFAVDADLKIRYERIIKRNNETDQIDFQTFIQNEKREMSSNNYNKQNLARCIQMADFKIENSGSLVDLYKQVDDILLKNLTSFFKSVILKEVLIKECFLADIR